MLDLSYNDLKGFYLNLTLLRELYLSGNKFLKLPTGDLFPNLQTLTMQVRKNHTLLNQPKLYVLTFVTPADCLLFSLTP